MAKKTMVTRTISVTIATALCLNTVSAEPFNQSVILSGTFKEKKALLKAVKNILENDEISVAKIVDVTIEQKLYGMTKQKFIENADILPPRETKDEQ